MGWGNQASLLEIIKIFEKYKRIFSIEQKKRGGERREMSKKNKKITHSC